MAGRQVIRFANGDIHIDPFGKNAIVEKWFREVDINKSPKYDFYSNIVTPESSELIVRFISDLSKGKNSPKGGFKKPRSHTTLHGYLIRLPKLISRMEKSINNPITKITEDETVNYFKAMQDGHIRKRDGGVYKDIRSYSKIFSSFWRWHMRVMRKKGIRIPDILETLNIDDSRKPEWNYFTLEKAKEMADLASDIYYSAFTLFLFDSGARPPKEVMNVRVKDISPVPNTHYLFLQVNDATSKTFGRKIKLMISSEILKKYIKLSKKKPEDFIFDRSYSAMMIKMKKLGHEVLGIGTAFKTKQNQTRIKGGLTLYDFRHNSVCHYLPLYNSEMQMQYRYGWTTAKMIYYYSEFMGMKDTISDTDMIDTSTKTQLQVDLEKEKLKNSLIQERFEAQQKEMEEKFKKLETMMYQKFAEEY